LSGRHYDHILSSTALALILACPLASDAQDMNRDSSKDASNIAAASTEGYPSQQSAAPATAASALAATEQKPGASDTPSLATSEPAPDPLASLDPADRGIAEKIRDLLSAKGDKLFASRKERAGVEEFYNKRNLVPLWLDKGVENARARAAIARLKNADTDGLSPDDYRTPDLDSANLASLAPEALAERELKLTAAVLTYARHVQAGRFPYTRVSRNIELPQAPPEPGEVLSVLADAPDVAKALDTFSPQHEPYRRLRAALAELRARAGANPAGRDRQIDAIIANMERWRWYPRDLGEAHVLVNEPDFTLRVMHKGAQVWTTRIVIGKPSMSTPLLSETMKYITINPTWHVPPSIVHNEYLPALAQDPTVLARMGLRVSYSGGDVQIWQPPGDGNALGRIRFNFPNRFLVYQHDTPDKYMFGHEVRAYSHGCMRVQDPAKYAEVLFNIARPNEHWTAEKIRSMFGHAEQDIQLQPTPIWVHLTYQTAFVDDAGKLQMRHDVYNLDGRTLAAIRTERGMVEPASERKREQEAVAAAPRRAGSIYHSHASVARSSPYSQSMFFGAPAYARPPRIIYR
jgi:murein L,D-transpeptidase YcbB/YkuD